MRAPYCCVAYGPTNDKDNLHVTFCGQLKTPSQLTLLPENAECKKCLDKIHELVGTDYSKLDTPHLTEKIINIKPTTV